MNKLTNFILILFSISLINKSFSQQITININAEIMERSCSISSSSSDFVINLPQGNEKNKKLGVPFSEKNFSINLEDCPENINTVKVMFTGESDMIMSNLIKINTSAFSAEGIALGLYTINKNNIDISNNLTLFTLDHTSNFFKLEFIVAYIKTMNSFVPGKVIATTDFVIFYE